MTVTTVVQDRPSKLRRSIIDVHHRTLKKSRRPLEKGSLTTRPVVEDGPPWERRSVTRMRWWTLGENVQWDIGANPMTARSGYDAPSSGTRSVIQLQTLGMPQSSPMTQLEIFKC